MRAEAGAASRREMNSQVVFNGGVDGKTVERTLTLPELPSCDKMYAEERRNLHEGGGDMKKITAFIIIILLVLAFGSLASFAGEHQMAAPVAHSRDFEKMKELVGVWEGKADMGKGPEQFKVTYELTSAGNAIVERFAAGQPHEMVTVYHDYNGKLAMTHYCSLGNQPHMELKSPGVNNFSFVLSEKNPNLASLNEMHMHALTIAVDGKDSITHTWTLYDKGEKKNEVVVKLARTKM